MTEHRDSALLSVSALKDLLSVRDRNIVLLDVRWVVGSPPLLNDYLAAHIPGAHFVDLDADLAGTPGSGGRHPLPDPHSLEGALRRWGVDPESTVVIYDGGASVAAARAWWVLRWAGLTDVRVLDGGFAAWSEWDGATESGPVADSSGTVTVHPGSLPVLDATSAGEWAAEGRLVDVRAPERFAGEAEPIDPVAGHIPGAVNIPTTGNAGGDGSFLRPAAIAARFDGLSAGHPGQPPLGLYCGSGVTAAHAALALHEAGLDAVLYPGSWSEWITDPARPVATGS